MSVGEGPLPPDAATDQGEEPEAPSVLYFAQGVLPNEEPEITTRLEPSQQYKGVRVPFNLQSALLNLSDMSRTDAVPFNLGSYGVGRIIRQFGIEESRKIFEGKGTAEQNAYLERIIELEMIRNAVASAIIETLGFNPSTVESLTSSMRDSSGMRDAVLGTTAELMKDHNTAVVPLGGLRVLAADALLPKRHRDNPNKDPDELLYPMAEAALADYLIRKRDAQYIAPCGGDFVRIASSKATIAESLRAFAIHRLGELHPERSVLLERRWLVTPRLDGLAFYNTGGSQIKDALRCEPYYYNDVSENGVDSVAKPLRVPMLPWETAWITNNLLTSSGRGVLIEGQAVSVVKEEINPVIRCYLARLIRDIDAQVLLRDRWSRGKKYSAIEQWMDDPNSLMPKGFSADDYNDLVRLECEAVAARTLEILETFAGST